MRWVLFTNQSNYQSRSSCYLCSAIWLMFTAPACLRVYAWLHTPQILYMGVFLVSSGIWYTRYKRYLYMHLKVWLHAQRIIFTLHFPHPKGLTITCAWSNSRTPCEVATCTFHGAVYLNCTRIYFLFVTMHMDLHMVTGKDPLGSIGFSRYRPMPRIASIEWMKWGQL
jgi:hypothetical protein